MTTPVPQVRRATIEDLPKLAALWEQENLPTQELEKRFKEFQLVEGSDGELLGAIGLQISGLDGRLHSEVFAHPEQSDLLRDQLWERTRVLAQNYGLVRLWTQLSTPFWNHSGFGLASDEIMAKLPVSFSGDSRHWQFLQLKEESQPASVDKEFAMFKEIEYERTQRLFRQAKILKLIAGLVVMTVFVLMLFWAFAWLKTQGRVP